MGIAIAPRPPVTNRENLLAPIVVLAIIGLVGGGVMLAIAARSVSEPIDSVRHCMAQVESGEAVAGNVGAELRYEYTVIGDPVNEAAPDAPTQTGEVASALRARSTPSSSTS